MARSACASATETCLRPPRRWRSSGPREAHRGIGEKWWKSGGKMVGKWQFWWENMGKWRFFLDFWWDFGFLWILNWLWWDSMAKIWRLVVDFDEIDVPTSASSSAWPTSTPTGPDRAEEIHHRCGRASRCDPQSPRLEPRQLRGSSSSWIFAALPAMDLLDLENPWTKWRVIVGKIELNGEFSSKPRLIAGGSRCGLALFL